jgi:hypothetical protein
LITPVEPKETMFLLAEPKKKIILKKMNQNEKKNDFLGV